ncbi:hypothetical protein B1R32_102272 [Abditibacterium utsteinense]|uniref:Uncharacterized protein n=2 Tax=Abditibacterium utsteinense TaxID=1960156 RepID=A0A2S8SWT6_9BACT|nr:hypothetical protein B1R32_102272 [Abditibacterium utsteinense]
MWLKKGGKNQPVIKTLCFIPDGFVGAIGNEVLTVFPNHWSGTSVTKSFGWGSWVSSTSGGERNIFLYASNSFLTIEAQVQEMSKYHPVWMKLTFGTVTNFRKKQSEHWAILQQLLSSVKI